MLSAEQLVKTLNDLFAEFDRNAEKHGCLRIRILGKLSVIVVRKPEFLSALGLSLNGYFPLESYFLSDTIHLLRYSLTIILTVVYIRKSFERNREREEK